MPSLYHAGGNSQATWVGRRPGSLKVVTRVRDYWPYNTSIRIWIITEAELSKVTDIGRIRGCLRRGDGANMEL
jgi:hypothetical protein